MKLGIVGTGTIVQEFLPKLINIEGIEVISIMDIPSQIENVKKLCQENNVEVATSSFDELCTAGIDTVYVAVPNLLHFDYCKMALEKGMNVIVEKPMTSHVKEAIEL